MERRNAPILRSNSREGSPRARKDLAKWDHDKFDASDPVEDTRGGSGNNSHKRNKQPRSRKSSTTQSSNVKGESTPMSRDKSEKSRSSDNVCYIRGDLRLTLRNQPANNNFGENDNSDDRTIDDIVGPLKAISLARIDSELSSNSPINARGQSPSSATSDSPPQVEPTKNETTKRPSISQKAKEQLIASMERKDRRTVKPSQKDIKIPSTSSTPKTAVNAPEFIPSGISLDSSLSVGSINSIPFQPAYITSTTEHDSKQPQMIYTHQTNSGHYVLMTESGVIIPPEYVYPPPNYFASAYNLPNNIQTGNNTTGNRQGSFHAPGGYHYFPAAHYGYQTNDVSGVTQQPPAQQTVALDSLPASPALASNGSKITNSYPSSQTYSSQNNNSSNGHFQKKKNSNNGHRTKTYSGSSHGQKTNAVKSSKH